MLKRFKWCLLVSVMAIQHADCALDFPTAYSRVLNDSIQLRLAESDINARAAECTQASLPPNPIFSCDVDNISENCKWNNAQSTFQLEQLIETGGKRKLRTRVGNHAYQAALADYQITQIVVLNNLSKAFVAAVSAQEDLNLSVEQAKIAEQVFQTVKDKVTHGKFSLIQQNKAEIAHSSALLEQEKAALNFMSAKERLAILWGSNCPDFDVLIYPFFEVCPPLSFEECWANFCNRPEILKASQNYMTASAAVELEKSARIPDVSVVAGYTAAKFCANRGFLLGFSVPLPIFDRNQGNIAKAYSDVFRSQDEAKLVCLLLESKFSIAYKELAQAYREVDKIRSTLLASANQTLDLAKEGYREGKYEFLEVLDAQHTLFEIKARYIDALLNYHYKKADFEYLTFDND